MARFALAIHGGAGLSARDGLTPEREAACREGLRRALAEGSRVLEGGGTALDAAVAAVVMLEDDPLFNAGHGAVLDRAGRVTHDAAVMDGRTGGAGVVAGCRRIRNPILGARRVMEHGRHVLMVGDGADAFAAVQGLAIAEPDSFRTPERIAQLERLQAGRAPGTDVYGTVGAVARDVDGYLAAATSTGGMVDKLPGRVGDTGVVGAGTWADARVAVSATGHGEPFIRRLAAARVASWMELADLPLVSAADRVVRHELPEGAGGLIAVDAAGVISTPFTTAGMFRATRAMDGTVAIGVW